MQRYLPYEWFLWKNGSIISQYIADISLYTTRIYNRRRKLRFRSIFYEYKEGAMTTNKMDHGILLSFCFLKNRIGSAFVEETALDWTRNMSACIKGRHINFPFVMVWTIWDYESHFILHIKPLMIIYEICVSSQVLR